MSSTARFALNAAANYGRFLLSMAVLFALTPFILHRLGERDFGLWTLTFSVLGFFALLDGGLATSVVKFIAQCRGADDRERRDRMVSTLAVAYLFAAAVASLGVGVLALFYNRAFSIPADQQGKAIALLWIIALRSVVLALPLSLFHGILFGEQRVYLINLVQCATTLLYAGAVWFCLGPGGGNVITLAWLNLGAMLAEYGAYAVFAFRFVPGLRLSLHLADRSLMREVAGFSAAQLLVNVATLIRLRTDPILVKLFLTLADVAVYAVALRISESFLLLTKQAINVLSPMVAQFHGAGETVKLRFVLVNAAKFLFGAATVLTVALCVFASDIVALWVGPSMAGAAPVLVVLVLAMWLVVPQMVAANVLVMSGHHQLSARAQGVGMVCNLVVSVALARPLGMVGVALGTLAATLIIDVAYVLPRACALQNVGWGSYVRRVFVPSFACGALQWGVTAALRLWAPPQNLAAVAGEMLPGATLFIVLFSVAFVESGERDLLKQKLVVRRRAARPVPVKEAA